LNERCELCRWKMQPMIVERAGADGDGHRSQFPVTA
jgi:hypothetical protein